MSEENQAEETEALVAEQESPTVEEPTPVETQPTEEEKNWKATREELKALKAENEALKSQTIKSEGNQASSTRGTLDAIYLDTNEQIELGRQELKAELKFPELENGEDPFALAVLGKYRRELDKYIQAKSENRSVKLPNAYDIATSVRGTWDRTIGEINRKSEVEGAKKAKEAVSSKEATIEAESGGSRAKLAKANEDIEALRYKSRLGGQTGIDAIAQRLSKGGF